jgi:hypothetical protein
MIDLITKKLGLSQENSGLNKDNFNLLINTLSSSGIATIVTIAGGLLYFLGMAIPCLSCGPVRVIILSVIAFIANLISIYKKCEPKLDNDTIVNIVKLALIPTVSFMIGYTIIPWILPLPIRFITWIGPGKTLIPAGIGGLLMIITNIVLPKFNIVTNICD